ncbi:MAG: hypothetical protein M1834_008682 [Cirrosporium novae-zelandiae]|nr:MAG: hypothetical protein M1834_008682 [Cirrosporium novae-zelandiae]
MSQNAMMEFKPGPNTPTTPRPHTSPAAQGTPHIQTPAVISERSSSFELNGLSGQMPLPSSPFPSNIAARPGTSSDCPKPQLPSRENSHKSVQSVGSRAELDHSDDDHEVSENESDPESGRPSKKKKGQRFFCTDFPPCTLSFTRSEHLARHIRKHTGERPFQCHCARRFSRLDNLRQHAQTVHQHEEIPNDSLAASGTRFQRQIRTDRVRAAGGRSRASTMGSTGSHGRGHSRNLSASSIASTTSNISQRDDGRRRPPPLIMANEHSAHRARLSLDSLGSNPTTPPGQYSTLATHSPGGFGTPTSTTFSGGTMSPGYGSTLGSPISSIPRNPGGYWGNRTPGRRLSVPTGANPFQPPQGNTYPPPHVSPLPSSSNTSVVANNSVYASPVSSNFTFTRNNPISAADAELRRRTWHPSTYSSHPRPATSGLSYYQTPDNPQPSFATHATAAANQPPRLPGIESFDQIQYQPRTPPRRREPSPMQIDTPSRITGRPNLTEQAVNPSESRRGHASHVSWDMSLHRNLTRLDITGGTPPKETGSWGQQVVGELQNVAARAAAPHNYTYPPQVTPWAHQESRPQPTEPHLVQQPVTPREQKRHAWYQGPVPTQQNSAYRRSPEDSSSSEGVPTPSTSALEYYPAIVHSNGYVESHHVPAAEATQEACAPRPTNGSSFRLPDDSSQRVLVPEIPPVNNDMGRLEALVAVATSEEKAATTSY